MKTIEKTKKAAREVAPKKNPIVRNTPKPPYVFPTTEIYTKEREALDRLTEKTGLTRCRLASLLLAYAIEKLESGAITLTLAGEQIPLKTGGAA